jgi:hypothetical protein
MSTLRTDIKPVGEFEPFVNIAASFAGLTGRKEPIHLDKYLAEFTTFVLKHRYEHPPAKIVN